MYVCNVLHACLHAMYARLIRICVEGTRVYTYVSMNANVQCMESMRVYAWSHVCMGRIYGCMYSWHACVHACSVVYVFMSCNVTSCSVMSCDVM